MFVVNAPFKVVLELPMDWQHREAAMQDFHDHLAEWGKTWGLSSTCSLLEVARDV